MKGGFDVMDSMQSQSFDSKSSALVCRAGSKWNLPSWLVHGVLPSPKYQGTVSFLSTKQSTMFHASQWYLSQYQVGCLVQVQAVGQAANSGGGMLDPPRHVQTPPMRGSCLLVHLRWSIPLISLAPILTLALSHLCVCIDIPWWLVVVTRHELDWE